MGTDVGTSPVRSPEAPDVVAPHYAPPGHTFRSITDKISSIVLSKRAGLGRWFLFALSGLLVLVFLGVVVYLVAEGVGLWGINIPVAWGFAITSFVWWIGIG